jgi:two-component system, sensor histidine kinase
MNPAELRAPPVSAGGSMHAAARVLLVEDDAISLKLASAMLARIGITVLRARDGAEALARVCDADPGLAFDLVLMDCQMPGIDGFEATRRIRAWEHDLGRASPLTIVAMTGNTSDGDRDACIDAGMSDYLAKPFSTAQLTAMVLRHLGTGAGAVPGG